MTPARILSIRRDALSRAYELIKEDHAGLNIPSRAVFIIEGEIAGLDFALSLLCSEPAARAGGRDREPQASEAAAFDGRGKDELIPASEKATLPGFSPAASLTPTIIAKKASSPEDRVQMAINSGITNPDQIENAVGAPMAEVERQLAAAPKGEKAPSQRDRVLAAYQAGHKTADAIALATGIGKASVGAAMSTLRKEGAIPADEKVKVLAAWEAGNRTPEEIAAHTGLGLPTARQYLHVLRREGAVVPEPETATPAPEPVAEAEAAPPSPAPFVGPKALISQAWHDGLHTPKEIAEKTGMKEATVIFTLGILRSEGKVDAPDWRLAEPSAGKS